MNNTTVIGSEAGRDITAGRDLIININHDIVQPSKPTCEENGSETEVNASLNAASVPHVDCFIRLGTRMTIQKICCNFQILSTLQNVVIATSVLTTAVICIGIFVSQTQNNLSVPDELMDIQDGQNVKHNTLLQEIMAEKFEKENETNETDLELETVTLMQSSTQPDTVNELLLNRTQNLRCNLDGHGQLPNSASLEVVTVTECGGLIQIPNLQANSAFLIDYKSTNNEEQCLWTLDSTKHDKSYPLKVRVTLLCDEFFNSSHGDTLSVLGWRQGLNLNWPLYENILNKEAPKYEPDQWDHKLFLNYFHTNVHHQSGFLLRIDILRVWCNHGSNFVFKTTSGSQTFGPFKTLDTFSMTIHPPSQTNFTLTFSVDYLDSKRTHAVPGSGSCQGCDVLHIYEIKPFASGGSGAITKLCESMEHPVSYNSTHPIVVLYCTKYSTTGQGFSLSWK